jgi:hypothetical protein
MFKSRYFIYLNDNERHKRKFGEISGGADHYLLITPIGNSVRNYLFQQGKV